MESLALQKLNDKRIKTRSGVSCLFFRLTETVGMKLYRRRITRNTCWFKQRYAHRYGLGPKAGDCFSLVDYDGLVDRFFDEVGEFRPRAYGYLTQIADRFKGGWEDRKLLVLEHYLKRIGLNYRDMSPLNAGMIGRNAVAVDFDNCSCPWIPGFKDKALAMLKTKAHRKINIW